MRLSERLGFGPKPYIFERPTDTKHDEDLNRWTVAVPLAFEAWFRQTFDRGRSIEGVYVAFRGRGEPTSRHILEGIEFVGRMEIADLASNGLRGAVLWDNKDNSRQSKFGRVLTQAYNNPKLSDHNHEHSRRHERWLESMFLNIGELRHSHSVFGWIDSAMLFSYWHDADQLLSLQRNLSEGKDLSVKKGHALAASVMILALHERYAIERKVSVHRAWEISAGTALMVAKHDIPEKFAASLIGEKPAFRQLPDGETELLSGEELKKAFDNNELDLFTISPSQLMELLRVEKEKYGFVDPNSSNSWGLHPDFEEEYLTELTQLSQNTLPILKDIMPEDRKSYRHAAEAVVLSDSLEMVAPPVESIWRTLSTQYSHKRPFFLPDRSMEDQLIDIEEGPGNVSGDGDSDVRRLLWELMNMEHVKDGIIAESPYIRSINRDNAILGALAVRGIGSRTMRGDLSDIDHLFKLRKAQIARKTLAKADFPKIQRIFLSRRMLKTGDDTSVVELLEKRGDSTLVANYREKIHNLNVESSALKSGFLQKPDSDGIHVRIYKPEDVAAFTQICDRVIGAISEKYSISPKRLKRYKAKALKGYFPHSIPYTTYDSIGGKPRALVAPLGIAGNL